MCKKPPLAPNSFPDLAPIGGLRLGGIACGLRYQGRRDMMLAVLDQPGTIGGVLTRSSMPSHPVSWCRKILPAGSVSAVLAIAGNANAMNGTEGGEALNECLTQISHQMGFPKKHIFAAQTGTIGEPMSAQPIINSLPNLKAALSENGFYEAATAIMTTDTFPKAASAHTEIEGAPVSITGFAKGSGMIAPNMATMLAFIFTDATLSADILKILAKNTSDVSFNCVSVDSDTSTSDSFLLIATNKAKHSKINNAQAPELADFIKALDTVTQSLARQLAIDGEGAQKLIAIHISGAQSTDMARAVGLAIANSPLVKTAIAGEDANWGRIVMAIGKTMLPLDPNLLSISMGGIKTLEKGQVTDFSEQLLDEHFKQNQVQIAVDLGLGDAAIDVWGCDLNEAYIRINADYRS